MKRFYTLIALCAAAAFALCACGDSGYKKATIELESNPSTGFEWFFSRDAESVNIETEYVAKKGTESLNGAGGTTIITVTPVEAGEVTITLEYKRSWEEDSTIKTYTYTFIIDDKLHIDVKDYSEGAPQPVLE